MEVPYFEVEMEDFDEENTDSDEEANFSVDMDWDDDNSENDNIDSINFDISLDSSDDWNTDDIDSINFDLSIDDMNDWNTDDSMNFDGSKYISGDSNDQEGSGNRFAIEQIRERRIVKFNVQGYDYRVRVDAFQREMSFDQAVIVLHSVLRGKLSFKIIGSCRYINIHIYITHI